jgi:hypothetical protein
MILRHEILNRNKVGKEMFKHEMIFEDLASEKYKDYGLEDFMNIKV